MKALLLALLLPGAALAEAPYDGFMGGVDACFASDTPESCFGAGAAACFDGAPDGQTTVGMMFCLLAEANAWDRILNAEYAGARAAARAADDIERANFPEYAVRADQVQAAQRAWIAFRDADCAMEYGIWGAGSMRQISGADCQLQMTARRAVDLHGYRQALEVM